LWTTVGGCVLPKSAAFWLHRNSTCVRAACPGRRRGMAGGTKNPWQKQKPGGWHGLLCSAAYRANGAVCAGGLGCALLIKKRLEKTHDLRFQLRAKALPREKVRTLSAGRLLMRPVELQRHPQPPRSHRMQPLARLPIFFELEGKRAIVAGDGAPVAWKAELLSATGANVEVFAEHPCEEFCLLAAQAPRGSLTLRHRRWQPEDFAGAAVSVGGFEDETDAEQFAGAARAAGVPVNVIDRPIYCDFSFGAIVNRSPLVIGISTDGAAPVFAQAIRAKLEAMIPRGFSRWAEAARRWRRTVQSSALSPAARRRFWQLFAAFAVNHPGHEPT